MASRGKVSLTYLSLGLQVLAADVQMSKQGYKTIAISASVNGGPMVFKGIIPMLDPPRHDTKDTIDKIRANQISVKMITGACLGGHHPNLTMASATIYFTRRHLGL
jgi:hypothetical protein